MFRAIFNKLINGFYDLSSTQVIILGNQKSGTTAIAKLLAHCSAQEVLLDTPLLWQPNLKAIFQKEKSLKSIIEQHKFYFARQIIKEPNLTFLFDQLVSIYPETVKYVFIVRDPRDNIRSLLNRIKVPGNLEDIQPYFDQFSLHEKVLFDKNILPYTSDHYIKQLAERWCMALDVYLLSKEKFFLVKYEEFNDQKEAYIHSLAQQLGFEIKKDIAAIVDVQYQPKGDQNVKQEQFFGKENLQKINDVCGEHMRKIGYSK